MAFQVVKKAGIEGRSHTGFSFGSAYIEEKDNADGPTISVHHTTLADANLLAERIVLLLNTAGG